MPVAGLRSPHMKLAGLYHFARMLDKVRLLQRHELPEEYHPNLGLAQGLDGHLCGFLGVEFTDVTEQVRSGRSDEEIAEWCFTRGLRPSKVQCRIWNEFARKFGWNDFAGRYLARHRPEDRPDLTTAFQVIDFSENAEPVPEPTS